MGTFLFPRNRNVPNLLFGGLARQSEGMIVAGGRQDFCRLLTRRLRLGGLRRLRGSTEDLANDPAHERLFLRLVLVPAGLFAVAPSRRGFALLLQSRRHLPFLGQPWRQSTSARLRHAALVIQQLIGGGIDRLRGDPFRCAFHPLPNPLPLVALVRLVGREARWHEAPREQHAPDQPPHHLPPISSFLLNLYFSGYVEKVGKLLLRLVRSPSALAPSGLCPRGRPVLLLYRLPAGQACSTCSPLVCAAR